MVTRRSIATAKITALLNTVRPKSLHNPASKDSDEMSSEFKITRTQSTHFFDVTPSVDTQHVTHSPQTILIIKSSLFWSQYKERLSIMLDERTVTR